MFIQLKNGQKAKKSLVKIAKKKFCIQFLNILWDEGYILGYNIEKSHLNIFLRYNQGIPLIKQVQFISKPSKRVYFSLKEIWKIDANIGLLLLSTNKGVLSLNQSKKLKVGGEAFVILK
jgi:small subunit ribosomal protein S8